MQSHPLRPRRVVSFAAALALLGGVLAVGCAPSAQNVPCRNDGECSTQDDRFAFCLRQQCVECVGRGSCDGHPCNDGVCEIPCKDGRCKDGRTCQDGMCVHD